MNAIIEFMSVGHVIQGSLLYDIDYCLFLNKLGIKTKLILIINEHFKDAIIRNNFLNKVKELINDRYMFHDIDIEVIYKWYNLLKYKFKHVILTRNTYNKIRGFMKSDNVHILSDYNNLQINDYRTFHNCIDYTNYIKKIWRDGLRPISSVNKDTFLLHRTKRNYPFIGDQFNQYICPIIKSNNLIMTGIFELEDFLKEKSNIICYYDSHPPNFFSLFDNFIYFSYKDYDFAPRLLIECYLLNKKVHYIKISDTIDGATIRNTDIVNGNISKYILTEDDELIQRVIAG